MQEFHDFKPSWVEMSEAKLKKLLTDQKYPYALMQNIFTQVRKIKADRKAARTKLTVLQQRWDDVLRPARTELATVRTMKSQVTKTLTTQFWNQSDKDKFNALCAYETVLVEVIQKLRKYQHEKDEEQQATPQQVAKLLREAGVRKMPNDGTHWTDYVGGATRKRVSAMFNALPEPRRGKRKTPFEHRISPEEFDRVLGVNLRGIYLTCRAAVPHLRTAGGGAIVVVASQLGLVAVPDAAAYCASKGAAVNLARAMALDHAAEGIRVNAVCPGPTDTPLVQRFFEETGDRAATQRAFEDATAIGRLI